MSEDTAQSPEASNAVASDGPGEPVTRQSGEEPGIETAIQTLVSVALEQDDPVSALDEGAEALAEALAQRDLAEAAQAREVAQQRSDDLGAYRHARQHRVSELVDFGYQLDDAIAITNANEAEIRARATATGQDPMDPIRQYAERNGYQRSRAIADNREGHRERSVGQLESLAAMSEEAFAEATKGDAWHRLMRGPEYR